MNITVRSMPNINIGNGNIMRHWMRLDSCPWASTRNTNPKVKQLMIILTQVWKLLNLILTSLDLEKHPTFILLKVKNVNTGRSTCKRVQLKYYVIGDQEWGFLLFTEVNNSFILENLNDFRRLVWFECVFKNGPS